MSVLLSKTAHQDSRFKATKITNCRHY